MIWDSPENKELVTALLALRTPEEVRCFLRDLMTEKEIEEFGKRFKAAKMLATKESYPQIQKVTGLSPTTIARVSKWLKKGTGGYRTIINRTHHHTSLSSERGLR